MGDCKTLIDLGCGYPSPIRSFSSRLHTVGVDAFASDLERSRAEGIHNDYREMDVLKVGDHFAKDSFECALASDLIEHLTKEQGQELIEMMEALARRRVIIFTPNGYLPQTAHSGNPWQEHKSGWSVSEMREAEYRVIGINGWKPLRTERSDSIQAGVLLETRVGSDPAFRAQASRVRLSDPLCQGSCE